MFQTHLIVCRITHRFAPVFFGFLLGLDLADE